MKAGFKPKLMTKKEWQDNRSSVAKGSGVGKALDAWQKHCDFNINSMTTDKLKAASQAANVLMSALDVAEKKCDKKKQKETIDGIKKYRTIAKNYQKCLKDFAPSLAKRMKFTKEVDGFGAVRKDAGLLRAYMTWATGPGKCKAEAHGYILASEKKMEDLYTKYVSTGDLNLGSAENKTMLAKFRDKEEVPDAVVEKARKTIISDLYIMLRQTVEDFVETDAYKEFVQRKYAVPNFSF